VQTEYTYESFGRTTASGASNNSSYQYTGRENDGTGLYYYRARYYQPELQRFVSEDPLEFSSGIHLYGYVDNNPSNFRDPHGLSPTQAIGAVMDFIRNYSQMRNWKQSDKYFHCKANCEAARRGPTGATVACRLSDMREWLDQNIKGDLPEDSEADQYANRYGRGWGGNTSLDCKIVCQPFRPTGLPDIY